MLIFLHVFDVAVQLTQIKQPRWILRWIFLHVILFIVEAPAAHVSNEISSQCHVAPKESVLTRAWKPPGESDQVKLLQVTNYILLLNILHRPVFCIILSLIARDFT